MIDTFNYSMKIFLFSIIVNILSKIRSESFHSSLRTKNSVSRDRSYCLIRKKFDWEFDWSTPLLAGRAFRNRSSRK